MSTRERQLRSIRSNVYGSQGQGEVLDVPRASVWRSATHNVATGGGLVNIEWDQVDWDTDGMWAGAASGVTMTPRLTCRTAGIYAVEGWVLWPSNATNFRQIFITKTTPAGTVTLTGRIGNPVGSVTVFSSEISTHVKLDAGDYITLAVAQNTGGLLVLPTSNTMSARDHSLQACLISTIN